jgi:hypothetical protein
MLRRQKVIYPKSILSCACLLMASTTVHAAQSPSSATSSRDSSGAVSYDVTYSFHPSSFDEPVVKGSPYAAEEFSTFPQLLSNGTRVETSESTRKIYRDGEGRTRVERLLRFGPNVPESAPIIEITDPAAGVHYTLDPQHKIAHRITRLPAGTKRPGPPVEAQTAALAVASATGPTGPPAAAPQTSVERAPVTATLPPGAKELGPRLDSLGTREMEGIAVVGQGYTKVAAAAALGDPPITIAYETWTSPDLKVVVLAKFSDSRNGERTVGLRRIGRSEPDAQLFQVPPDYTIINETGAFEIKFTSSPR